MTTEARAAAADVLGDDVNRWIILTDQGDQTKCAWWGMSAEQVVEHLRSVAQEIEFQRTAPKGKAN